MSDIYFTNRVFRQALNNSSLAPNFSPSLHHQSVPLIHPAQHIKPSMMPRYLKKGSPSTAASSSSAPTNVPSIVSSVIDDIRKNRDSAVRSYSEKFDKWSPPSFKLSPKEIKAIISSLPEQVIKDIKEVQNNVRTFAQAQKESLKDFELEIHPGVFLGQKNVPINSVGW